MSDLHIGSGDCDLKLLVSDLEWAKRAGATVLINGDVADLLLPKDQKRFTPSVLDGQLSGRDAVLNATLDLTFSVLKPYARNLAMIGCGNHESSATRHHSVDFVRFLLDRLAQLNPKIAHGGYTGAVVFHFRRPTGGGSMFKIMYLHGAGGTAPVTKGMIDFNRFAGYARNANLLWLGHKHNRFVAEAAELFIPEAGDELEYRPVWHVMTGAYTQTTVPQLDSAGHYQSHWATERGFAPQGHGGVRLWLVPECYRNTVRVRCEIDLRSSDRED